eukprot:UN05035
MATEKHNWSQIRRNRSRNRSLWTLIARQRSCIATLSYESIGELKNEYPTLDKALRNDARFRMDEFIRLKTHKVNSRSKFHLKETRSDSLAYLQSIRIEAAPAGLNSYTYYPPHTKSDKNFIINR